MFKKITLVVVAATMLAGCSGMTRQQQRALSGGAIGAAGGAAIAAVAGGPVLLGAGLGAATGATVGALTH